MLLYLLGRPYCLGDKTDLMKRFTDKQLTCIDCGTVFTFTAGEQQFYSSKKFSPPKRCKACRDKRFQARQEAKHLSDEHLYRCGIQPGSLAMNQH